MEAPVFVTAADTLRQRLQKVENELGMHEHKLIEARHYVDRYTAEKASIVAALKAIEP
jgi:hypothetical protein